MPIGRFLSETGSYQQAKVIHRSTMCGVQSKHSSTSMMISHIAALCISSSVYTGQKGKKEDAEIKMELFLVAFTLNVYETCAATWPSVQSHLWQHPLSIKVRRHSQEMESVGTVKVEPLVVWSENAALFSNRALLPSCIPPLRIDLRLIQKPIIKSVSGRSARLRQMRLPAVHPLYL